MTIEKKYEIQSRITDDLYSLIQYRSFVLLVLFAWFFAKAGSNGYHLSSLWILAMIMIIDLFYVAIKMSEVGK